MLDALHLPAKPPLAAAAAALLLLAGQTFAVAVSG
jgi:hypothetical protein